MADMAILLPGKQQKPGDTIDIRCIDSSRLTEGCATSLATVGQTLCELTVCSPKPACWISNSTLVPDGDLVLCTPIDPVLVLVSITTNAEPSSLQTKDNRKRSRPGSFGHVIADCFVSKEQLLEEVENLIRTDSDNEKRPQVDTISAVDSMMLSQILGTQLSDEQLSLVCETKDVCGEMVFKLSHDKIIAWLLCKLDSLTQALVSHHTTFATLAFTESQRYALRMLKEYVADGLVQECADVMGIQIDDPKPAQGQENRQPEPVQQQTKPTKEDPKAKAQAARKESQALKLAQAAKSCKNIMGMFQKAKQKKV